MDKLQLPEGVELSYTDKAAHVTTNDALMHHLRKKGNGSMPLTRTILAEYQIERGAPLKIAERSMATELLIHAYLDGVFAGWVRFCEKHLRENSRFCKTARRLKTVTAVIDMGERSVDTNRWVFDLLSHGYGLICLLLGSRA